MATTFLPGLACASNPSDRSMFEYFYETPEVQFNRLINPRSDYITHLFGTGSLGERNSKFFIENILPNLSLEQRQQALNRIRAKGEQLIQEWPYTKESLSRKYEDRQKDELANLRDSHHNDADMERPASQDELEKIREILGTQDEFEAQQRAADEKLVSGLKKILAMYPAS